MHCQLDQVGRVLDIADAVKKSLIENPAEKSGFLDFSREASAIMFGLLLLEENDVFLKEGLIKPGGKEQQLCWVELYLDGEPFVLIAVPGKAGAAAVPEIALLPEDEVLEPYDLSSGKDREWQRGDCRETVWQAVLDNLKIKKTVPQVLDEISDLA